MMIRRINNHLLEINVRYNTLMDLRQSITSFILVISCRTSTSTISACNAALSALALGRDILTEEPTQVLFEAIFKGGDVGLSAEYGFEGGLDCGVAT